jgi:predicted dehydrogenase
MQQGSAAGTAVGLFHFFPARVLGRDGEVSPNDQIRIGVIGTGGRSRQLVRQVPSPGRVVAFADCNRQQMLDALTSTQIGEPGKFPMYADYREMFDKERLDAVIVGTPDHARTLPCIRAVQAGLDVYAEKPLTAYVREGRILVDAVRRHNRILQVGTQQRTMEINRFCCEFIREGRLGKIQRVLGCAYPGPRRYQGLPEQPIPDGNHWDVWCGPTELRPYNHALQHGWMQFRDYSGGEMTNWGAHGIDQIQSALGKSHSGPSELWPLSPGTDGNVAMRYDDGTEVHFQIEMGKGPAGGAIFVGTDCKMEINRNRFATNPPDFVKDAPQPAVAEKWEGEGWIARPHIKNFLDCIESRELPNADVEIGHRSVSVCHLLNITRELGRRVRWDPEREQFIDDDEANRLLDRPRRSGYELPPVAGV